MTGVNFRPRLAARIPQTAAVLAATSCVPTSGSAHGTLAGHQILRGGPRHDGSAMSQCEGRQWMVDPECPWWAKVPPSRKPDRRNQARFEALNRAGSGWEIVRETLGLRDANLRGRSAEGLN